VDFGGFWICCSTKNSASFDIKNVSIPIYSGSNSLTARLLGKIVILLAHAISKKCMLYIQDIVDLGVIVSKLVWRFPLVLLLHPAW